MTFDAQVASDVAADRTVLPRALDDPGTGLEGSGYDEGLWIVEYDAGGVPLPDLSTPDPDDVLRHLYPNDGALDGTADGSPVWLTGTALAHPGYSDFTNVLHDQFYALRGTRIEAIWPLQGRGRLA